MTLNSKVLAMTDLRICQTSLNLPYRPRPVQSQLNLSDLEHEDEKLPSFISSLPQNPGVISPQEKELQTTNF